MTTTAIRNTLALDDVGFHEIEAMATALDGFTVRNDYQSVVKNYMREEMTFWPLLPKIPAEADPVQELTEGPEPTSGFMSKIDLNPPENASDLLAHAPIGTPQGIKAAGGVIKIGHYARSLYRQQNQPYGNIIGRKTEKLIISTCRSVEQALFTGDATTNPLQFNGLYNQMATANRYTASVVDGDSVVKKLRGIARLASSDPLLLNSVDTIFTSGLGVELIEEEVDTKLEYHNLESIRPGLRVPAIITQSGTIPIIPTPYIQDTDGGAGNDTVYYYLVNMKSLTWKGVYPDGGDRTFDPQIFEVGQYTASATPYLLDKRLCLIYGTLHAENAGRGIYRLAVTVPPGRVGGI